MATGQAAGVCAALAAASGRRPRDVEVAEVAEVRTELIRQGADLGERILPARDRRVGVRE